MTASPGTVLAIAIGLTLIAVGLWMLRASAMPRHGDEDGRASPRRGMSFASRASIGLSLMFAGYHIGAWGSPEAWLALRVPRERWYLLVGGIGAAVGVSLALDRRDSGADTPAPRE